MDVAALIKSLHGTGASRVVLDEAGRLREVEFFAPPQAPGASRAPSGQGGSAPPHRPGPSPFAASGVELVPRRPPAPAAPSPDEEG